MNLFLEYAMRFNASGGTSDDLRDQAARIMEALLALEGGVDGFTDSAVSVDTGRRIVDIELAMRVPEGMTRVQAEIAANSAIRTAIHASGGHTPDWDCTLPAVEERAMECIDA